MWTRAAALLVLTFATNGVAQEDLPTDPQSGLIVDHDWTLVYANCSGCHSTRLVAQNRMNAAGWLETIRWMQKKHNLWDLGENESRIVTYLEKHYGATGLPPRRKPLDQPPLNKEDSPP